jgi:hypothetical protein
MSTAYQKGIRKLRKQAMEQGWREAEKKAGWMLYSPDGHHTSHDPQDR